MAHNTLDQEALCCSICLELLKDPVTIPCGHSYCMRCVQNHWDREDQKQLYSCPECRQSFSPRPVLVKNILIANLVEQLTRTTLKAPPADLCYAGPGNVVRDGYSGRKLKVVRSCVASYCETHLHPHYEAAVLPKLQLVAPSDKIHENIFSEHEAKKMFCGCDQQLLCLCCCLDQHKDHDMVLVPAEKAQRQAELQTRRDQLLEGIQHKEADLGTLQQQVLDIRRSAQEAVHPTLTELMTNVSRAPVDVLLSPANQPATTREDFLRYSQEITLDPNTTNIYLSLSDENRTVTNMKHRQRYPDHLDRFTYCRQVLSTEGLMGRCYWEVEWTGNVGLISVAYKDIGRKRVNSFFGYNDKSWALLCAETTRSFIFNSVWSEVTGPVSSRLGVYLDHSAGVLSFYSVSETMSLLHTVQTTFTQPLYTGVCLYYNGDSAQFPKLK